MIYKIFTVKIHLLLMQHCYFGYSVIYALVIAQLQVQYGQYFPRFSYFVDLFHKPLGE